MSLKEKLDAMRAAKDEGRIFPPDVVHAPPRTA